MEIIALYNNNNLTPTYDVNNKLYVVLGSPSMTFRLADKPVGRLEARYHGIWGAVCADNIDLQDAHVVCRMMGYSQADLMIWHLRSVIAIRFSLIIKCFGNESSTEECSAIRLNRINTCAIDRDVLIVCKSTSGNYNTSTV
jgi:hypothetical protein